MDYLPTLAGFTSPLGLIPLYEPAAATSSTSLSGRSIFHIISTYSPNSTMSKSGSGGWSRGDKVGPEKQKVI